MAEKHDNRKLVVYRSLFKLNKAFEKLHNNLRQLIAAQTVQPEYAVVWQDRLDEIQGEINRRLTGILNEQESADTRRLGQINEQREESVRRKKTKRR
jgi:hypothetical protein